MNFELEGMWKDQAGWLKLKQLCNLYFGGAQLKSQPDSAQVKKDGIYFIVYCSYTAGCSVEWYE